jgi:hypothetical protein
METLNTYCDLAVSEKPEFRKTILQCGNSCIDQDISILVNGSYIRLLLDLLPLTGREVMRGARMRLFYAGGHGYEYFCPEVSPVPTAFRELGVDLFQPRLTGVLLTRSSA